LLSVARDYNLIFVLIRPDVDYTCDIQFDPFIYMRDNNKTYSFTISLIEFVETIPTLWDTTKEFMQAHPEHIAKDNAMHFVSDDGESYNMCHCTPSHIPKVSC
jgi:alpha 1,2-mannosyltransferase